MADAMSQLHKTVASLREQLKNHGIAEGTFLIMHHRNTRNKREISLVLSG